jgi:hypothetical protein
MNYFKQSLLPLFFTSLFFHPLKAQGPIDGFLKGKRTLDLAFSGGFQQAETYIGANGPFAFSRRFGQGSFFAEYGLFERLDIVASIPFVGESLQDGSFFAKGKVFSLWKKRIDFICALGASFPMANYPTELGQSIGQRATQLQSKLVAQIALPKGLYFQIQGGYNRALDPVPNALLLSSKIMWTPGKWYLDAWVNKQNGEGNKFYKGSIPINTFRELTVNYTQVGGTVYRTINSSFGAFINGSKIIAGKGTFITSALGLGFTYKMKFSKKKFAEV